MPSIVNGLFAGRSGISSHGNAIAVVGDNISNASTVGYKAARAEFEDIVAGGQAAGKIVGSGSGTSAINTIFTQGTTEFTGRALDLAIDGNGMFVVAEGAQRFYTRAGNFAVNDAGFIVDNAGRAVMGFPTGGNGSLQAVNINAVSQNSIDTTSLSVSGNVDASAATIAGAAAIPAVPQANGADPGAAAATATSFADLNAAAEFQTVMDVFDTLGQSHTVTFFFFHTGTGEYTVRGYVDSADVDDPAWGHSTGYPRLLEDAGANTDITMLFDTAGQRTNAPAAGASDITMDTTWANGSTSAIDMSFDPFTSYASNSNILTLTQDGQGVGAVTSVNIEADGDIFAVLDNGQTSVIGQIGMVNFSNPEGLVRIGGNLLQQSSASGAPIVGTPGSGTFGSISSGALELSTVDIANEFVKLITLQRGFQANSRIITTINQLLNEIIQLA